LRICSSLLQESAQRSPKIGRASADRIDIGAESQEETALSILGEILSVRAGRPGGRLKDAKRRIHAQADAPAPA